MRGVSRKTFQYISCYSLSSLVPDEGEGKQVSIHLMLLFIMNMEKYYYMDSRSFNTSHVTLYRQTVSARKKNVSGFNTSHVTLYPCVSCEDYLSH